MLSFAFTIIFALLFSYKRCRLLGTDISLGLFQWGHTIKWAHARDLRLGTSMGTLFFGQTFWGT
jgi:hypothetical protein